MSTPGEIFNTMKQVGQLHSNGGDSPKRNSEKVTPKMNDWRIRFIQSLENIIHGMLVSQYGQLDLPNVKPVFPPVGNQEATASPFIVPKERPNNNKPDNL
jgi:hypothetical protein